MPPNSRRQDVGSVTVTTRFLSQLTLNLSHFTRFLKLFDILPYLKEGDSYGFKLLSRLDSFGGFLLLTALTHRSLHRLTGHDLPLIS